MFNPDDYRSKSRDTLTMIVSNPDIQHNDDGTVTIVLHYKDVIKVTWNILGMPPLDSEQFASLDNKKERSRRC